MSAKAFIENVRPFQGRFVAQTGRVDMFGNREWVTVEKRLHAKAIGNAIYGKVNLGWLSAFSAYALCFDIDAHDIDAEAYALTPTLHGRYIEAVRIVGHAPSLLFQTPRGLHAYWLLTQPIPDKVLLLSMSERSAELKRVFAELKGTSTQALRIPRHDRQLNPETLAPIPLNFDGQKFNPVDLLNETPATLRENLRQRQAIVRSSRTQRQLTEFENQFCFAANASNEALIKLAGGYRARGLSHAEAVERLRVKLFADGYRGELSNLHRLSQRVASTFKNVTRQPIADNVKSTLTFTDLEFIDTLTAKHPFARQRTQAVRRFLESLFYWLSWHDTIWKESQRDVTLLSWLYAGYRTQRRLGRYPIPARLIEKWNARGYEVFSWLIAEGVVHDPKTKFYFVSNNLASTRAKNPGYLSTCKFYEVRRIVEAPRDTGLEILLSLAETHTQSQLARLLGVSQGMISQVLSGKRGLTRELSQIITEVGVIKYNIDLTQGFDNTGCADTIRTGRETGNALFLADGLGLNRGKHET